ncbi:GNAT family N-acetyltransferase [Amycolatopsis sp. cmx-4-54]|uniref:GNAT family N-acetyltransferase n=1 Tax=Amycolatopsis sp. cmx-4-54 TaxID=2790936 RepID=UPI0039785181
MIDPLYGELTKLREFRSSDGGTAFKVVGDDRVTTYLSFDSRTPEMAQKMIDDAIDRADAVPRTEYYLAITRLDEDELIGTCRIAFSGVKAAKLGYATAADHWKRGYTTDAVRTILTFAFERLELHRITAAIGPDNHASQAVVKRLGFTREGVLRDHVFTNGSWRDSVLYSLLRNEWLAN